MTTENTTWAGIKNEIERLGLRQNVVAEWMGYRPDVFNRLVNATESFPTTEWVERFYATIVAHQVKSIR